MDVEAVLLTGGASRRMGSDKAALLVEGEPMAPRLARRLGEVCRPVTVLGQEPLPGRAFLRDSESFAGPMAALSRFVPTCELVFVASCDLVRFDPRLVHALGRRLGRAQAAMPTVDGRLQPLCALYRDTVFAAMAREYALGERRLSRFARSLDPVEIAPADLVAEGLDVRCVQSANTLEELATLLAD